MKWNFLIFTRLGIVKPKENTWRDGTRSLDDARQTDGTARPHVKFRGAHDRRQSSCCETNKVQNKIQCQTENYYVITTPQINLSMILSPILSHRQWPTTLYGKLHNAKKGGHTHTHTRIIFSFLPIFISGY